MIEDYVVAASTYAQDIDNLILLIGAFVGFWFLLAEAVFFLFILKFRVKPEDPRPTMYMDGSDPSHKRWITIPHLLVLVCDVFIVYGAVVVWMDVKQTLPADDPECVAAEVASCTAAGTDKAACEQAATKECAPRTVRVIGQQWAWTFVHPGPDGALDTDDDIAMSEGLHVQGNRTYHFELTSKDVLHNFSVPVFRLKQDAIPGRFIRGWFKAIRNGIYDIQCAEMCGIGHGLMPARIVIETKAEHEAWMKNPTNNVFAAREI